MSRAALALALCITSATLIFAPGLWLAPDRFTAWATGVQAFGLVLALGVAYGTLSSEVRERRLDRLQGLNSLLMEGEIGAARYRFVRHLREHRDPQGHIPRISRDDLMGGMPLAAYVNYADQHPRKDANQVIRHFERVDALRRLGSLDDELLFEFFGAQVVWWDNALHWENGRPGSWGIHRLADWARSYVAGSKSGQRTWGEWEWDIVHDFGHGADTPLPLN